jgi:general secretion pathway protein C
VSLEGLPVSLKVLGFKLSGTVVADDSAESYAILDSQSARKQELYREGDQVGEALVKKILRNKVVLSTDKGDEVLTMDFEETRGGTSAPRPSRWSGAGQMPGAGSSDSPAEIEGVDSPLADLGGIMRQVQLAPYPPGEQPAGVRVSGPANVLTRLRLRSGDMITGVNGEAITDPDQAREFFENLAQGEEVIVDIRRRNRPRKIRLR